MSEKRVRVCTRNEKGGGTHLGDEVDAHALAAEAPGAADAVDVVLTVGRQVVVDHQRHLHNTKKGRENSTFVRAFMSIGAAPAARRYHAPAGRW